MHSKTIAAISTPRGEGGIGIVKISGTRSIQIANAIFRSSPDNSAPMTVSNVLRIPSGRHRGFFHGYAVDETGRCLDEVLILIMPSPHSYTRQDIVEIHCHGGIAVVNTLLDLVLKQGAVLAEPGEFTKLAFLNGRIDLTQAEAVMDIINARSVHELSIASNQLRGSLKESIEAILQTLYGIIAEGEAEIDFPEEVQDLFKKEKSAELLKEEIISPVEDLIHFYHQSRIEKKQIKVVIIGKPNVGKSSLMNGLLETDRVIVADFPGTTRDFIEEALTIKNLHIALGDTAGLHETEDAIEQIGIQKARHFMMDADLVLFVLDASGGVNHDDTLIYDAVKHKNIIVVLNKCDLLDDMHPIDMFPKDWNIHPVVSISAKFQIHLDLLKKEIYHALSSQVLNFKPSGNLSPNPRHFLCLDQCLESANSALSAIKDGLPVEFCVIDLKSAAQALEEIIGISAKADILDLIFSQFCIGK